MASSYVPPILQRDYWREIPLSSAKSAHGRHVHEVRRFSSLSIRTRKGDCRKASFLMLCAEDGQRETHDVVTCSSIAAIGNGL